MAVADLTPLKREGVRLAFKYCLGFKISAVVVHVCRKRKEN